MNFGWQTAFKIAWRESRASSGRFAFVVLAVALGVGSLTGVRGFSTAFREMLLKEARTLMAADLTIRIFGLPSPEQQAVLDKFAQRGAISSNVTETLSMIAVPGADPILASIKAVDPKRYPFYGELKLDPPGLFAPRMRPDSVLLSTDLAERLNLHTGDPLEIGGQSFHVVGTIVAEPDRMNGSLNVGPRAMITREGLDRTGLIRTGSRAAQRFLLKLLPGAPAIAEIRNTINKTFPEARITDYREANPQISEGLERATTFLSLVTLIALIVGALGVGTAMHAHLQQKMDSIAIMKSIGARSSQVIRIYALQTLLLGVAGGVLGVAAGLLVQLFFPVLIVRYFQIQPEFSLDLMTGAQGLLAGILTTLLFTLPPLVSIRAIKPNLILRREMAAAPRSWRDRLADARLTLVAGALISAGVFGLALWLIRDDTASALRVAGFFVGALIVSLALLAGVAWLLLRGLRLFVRRSPWRLSPALRHGISNVYRPGAHASAILTALGIGVMFTLTIYLLQRSVLADIQRNTPPGMPNVFLLDITAQQRDEVMALLMQQPGMEKNPEIISTVSGRLVQLNGKPVDPHITRTRPLTTSTDLKPGEMTLSDRSAAYFKFKVGDVVGWNIYGRTVTTRIVRLHKGDVSRLRSFVEFCLSPADLQGYPAVLYGGVRAAPSSVVAVQKAVYKRFPTVTVINMAEVLDRLEEVIGQISLVIRFVSLFAIIAGATILASSVAGTRYRRLHEVVILKTLGATRARIVRIFSVEFLILGTVAGLMGSLLASGFTMVLLKRLLKAPIHLDVWPNLAAVVLTALIAAVTGWLASYRILAEKPLEVLRSE